MSDIQPKEWKLRPIEAADNAQMAVIIRAVMTEFGAVGPGYSILDPEVDQIFETYNNDHSAFFVVDTGERIVGGAGVAPLDGGSASVCELKKMYFLPEGRGKGFGKKMIDICLQAARERDFKKCYLETVERMSAANGLYQKMGFRKLACAMGNTGHGGCDTFYALDL